jgi:hypothetical protein
VNYLHKEVDMELSEPNIRMGHPPPSISYKKNSPFSFKILFKVTLFIIVFVLFFHLPNFTPRFNNRRESIQEIRSVLERYQKDLASVTREELAKVIYEEANRYNCDPKFILALIATESSFKNRSVSERGARGLMQIMPHVAQSIAQELGIEWRGDHVLFNPILNIRMGIYYLSRLILDFNDLRVALAAYNYGPTYIRGLIDRNQRIPIHYYHKIITVYQTI